MTRVIITADDFGRSADVNAAVVRAHREGVLTSASLMVTGEAAGEAVRLARECPGLALGLHVVLARGRAALPPDEIPLLVDRRGRFRESAARAGVAYYFDRAARGELARELQRQLELFAATGFPLSHVDGHMNLHVHPTVLPLLLPLAVRFGARGFRLPAGEPWSWVGLRAASAIPGVAALRALALRARPAVRRHGLVAAERVHGLLHSGRMGEARLMRIIERLRGASAEIYLHPSVGEREDGGPNPGDLQALLSPRVRQALASRGAELTTYARLGDD